MNSNTKRHIEVGEMSIEILAKNESVKYVGQSISFHQQETLEIKSRIRAAWATFHKDRQELTSKNYMLKHRLRLFDATVSPTLCYAAGTWTPSKEHERMIQSTQRKMLRLIIQTKRKYKKIEKQDIEPKEEKGIAVKTENCSTDDESGDGQSTKSKDDVDSEVTFDEDSEKDIDTIEIEEEDWIDYIRRSTADAIDKMEHARIRCWNKTHRKMKWKLALRIATSPSERGLKKAAEWNPELSSRYRTYRTISRPRKRWEDDINDFLKQNLDGKENEEPPERKSQNNNNWINIAKDWRKWDRLEGKYNELCKMTENKKRRDDDLEQSSSSASTLRNASRYWKHVKQQQQHSGQEHCDGGRTRIKKYVTGSQQRWKNYVRPFSYQRRKIGTIYQVRLLRCGFPPSSLRVLSLLLVSLAGSSPPGFLLSFCYFCGVAPNPRIL